MSTRGMIAGLIGALVAVAAAGGYWIGQRHATPAGAAAADSGATSAARTPGRRILYYRNPMGLPDTSPTPKKDSMGMDYIPVYEGEDDSAGGGAGAVKISAEKIQQLGVRTAKVERRALDARVRATGRVEIDERRLATVTAKYEGYIERLYVNATGQAVARGQVLFDAYSPELLAARREYAAAAQGVAKLKDADAQTRAGMQRLADSALARLRNWDVAPEDVARLAAGEAAGETANEAAQRTLGFRSPAAGIVMERKATQGMRFMPGDMLYQIADLSSVWVIAEVFEQDIGRVRAGQTARLSFDAYPGQTMSGRVTYVYPTLNAETRTARLRIELPNPGLRLKPAMYAKVELPVGGEPVLAVPAAAVIDSGARRVVLVDRGEGRFEPRDVQLGARGDDFVAVTEGLRAGETVVVAANFLIDAESNLKAALSGLTAPADATRDAATLTLTYQATGTLDDADNGKLVISHEPVARLNWPKMTMEFTPADAAIAQAAKVLKPGAAIAFEFAERKPGEWVVTKIEPKQ